MNGGDLDSQGRGEIGTPMGSCCTGPLVPGKGLGLQEEGPHNFRHLPGLVPRELGRAWPDLTFGLL